MNLELSTTAHGDFAPTRERPVPRLKPRGVWLADVLDAMGNPLIQAVSHDGRVVSQVPWLEGISVEHLISEMWHTLDKKDPALAIIP